ncbi:phenylacetate-CoA ligase [Candidatus Magnetomoraceae bacterium gMMP-13]
MKTPHLWQGEWIDDHELNSRAAQFPDYIHRTIQKDFPLEALFLAADALASEIKAKRAVYYELEDRVKSSGKIAESDIAPMFQVITSFLQRESLETKLKRELGTVTPFVATRMDYNNNFFEHWAPLGLIVHSAPSNVFTVSILCVMEGLLTGNINFLKTSGSETLFPQYFLKTLCDFDLSGQLKDYIIVGRISSKQKKLLAEIFQHADAISAWGSEESIAGVRELAPHNTLIIEWGHKISLAYITEKSRCNNDTLQKLAYECCNIEQQACSSPQTVFVEVDEKKDLLDFAHAFAAVLSNVSAKIPRISPGFHEQAEITTITEITKLESCLGNTEVIEARDKSWRIFIDFKPSLRTSPLFRSVWLMPLKRKEIISTLTPLKSYLQTVGVACEIPELAELSSLFVKAGALRINQVGQMLENYIGAPHDGVYALPCYAKRISIQMDDRFSGYSTFFEFQHQHRPVGIENKPVLTKQLLTSKTVDAQHADLFFKSGGSTGKPLTSIFTYDDYHAQMQSAAYGLYAAGLDPIHDKAINLFAAGNLYGGFLSFFSILESLGVPQLPMALIENHQEVAKAIVNYKVNTIISVPAYILELFKTNRDLLKSYQGIKKIFYGGEPFTAAQVEYLINEFGVKTIRSAIYGSNDAGPMGYQCPYCKGGQHHLLSDIQYLEIFKMDEDQPVEGEEPGRLLFTSRYRKSQEFIRYEIGDIGRWIHTPCACGRKAPLFELMGRHGDIFRAGILMNYQKFIDLINVKYNYSGSIQIVLEKSGIKIQVSLLLEKNNELDSEKIRSYLLENYKDLYFAVTQLDLDFAVRLVEPSVFEYVPQTGKLRHIVDKRAL